MPARTKFPRLNSRYDLKHIRDDFHTVGMPDPDVYEFAHKEKRLILTFNGDDFKPLAPRSQDTGILFISDNLSDERIDSKLTALLSKSTPNALYGKFTPLTGET